MKIVSISLIVFISCMTISFAEEMTNGDIKECYYQSYLYENQKRYSDAIAALKPIYLNYPNTYTVNYRLGWLYYLNQNYANAIEHLNQATAISPQSSEIIRIMIYIYQSKFNWYKVENLSVQLLKLDYYNISGNFWYAVSLKMQGKYSLAIKIVNKMLAIQPTSVLFLQELGENLYLSQNIKESYSVFNNLLIISPQNPTALYYLDQMKTVLSGRSSDLK